MVILENPSVKTKQKRKRTVETQENWETIGETEQNHEQTVELSETSKTNGENLNKTENKR